MTSKVSKVTDILKGAHVMGDTPQTGLAAYHDAKAVVNTMRKVGWDCRLAAIQTATKNYRVTVSLRESAIRIYRPDTKAELLLTV